MGAGRPKFKIWLVMLAGWKKKTMSGNFSRRRLRSSHFVIAGGAVFLLVQRNQDFAVGAGDGRDVALGDAGQLLGMPMLSMSSVDLVRRDDVADFAFDRGEPHFGLFDARAGGAARMQPHLAGIDIGKEILANQPEQAQARRQRADESREHAARDAATTNRAGRYNGSGDARKAR